MHLLGQDVAHIKMCQLLLLVGLAYQGKDNIVFKFIIQVYSIA
jgi:hypothetical protein